jgi:hypothetical protein
MRRRVVSRGLTSLGRNDMVFMSRLGIAHPGDGSAGFSVPFSRTP